MKDNVTLIPARRRTGNRVSKEENKPKLKVAAYCRVFATSPSDNVLYSWGSSEFSDNGAKFPQTSLTEIRSGNSQVFMLTTVFRELTQKSVKASMK